MRALLIILVLAACGEDEGGGSTQKQGNATPAPPAAAGVGSGSAGKQLVAQLKIEERVPCTPPPPTAKRCDPKLPALVTIPGVGSAVEPNANDMRCDPKAKEFCLATVDVNNQPMFGCGTCPERDAIRYPFSSDRDFVVTDNNRDPFQSYLVRAPAAGSGDPGLQRTVTERCLKKDQFQAVNYSYKDLKPVGVVAQGTMRKVLMMDPGNLGHIIKPKDCVGKEKAVVSDIGDEFICFQQEANAATGQALAPDCRRLRQPSVALTSQPSDVGASEPGGPTAITPVIAPPPAIPPRTPERAPVVERPPPAGKTTIQPAPQQPPTTIKP